MSGARWVYNALLPAAVLGAHAAARLLPKMRAAVDGRRGFRGRWEALARDLNAPPVWFHVASVGEFEQARPVISALERARPDLPVVLTFSSPSGYAFARKRETPGRGSLRFIDYLPFDTAPNMRFCLEQVKPRLLVFVKFDLWPNLVWEADARGVPIVLIDATLSASSGRLAPPARWLYRDVYRRLDAILAISDDDAARFRATVPSHPSVSVTGDTRFDRVMDRWQQRTASTFALPAGGPTLIAGSTWPPDEERLLPALARLLSEDARLRVVLVPHEPTPAHVEPLRRWAAGTGSSARIVIVDVVGVLAEAYRFADLVYVGGAFTTGVHSVIEPAIAGVPVVFGPKHDNSFEALQLVERGAARVIRTADEAYHALAAWLRDEAARKSAGAAGRAYVESQLGATEKCMAALAPYL
ncbi:MAG TPA: glycosyltransferase N-terminal domain-containing protein [Candidatus Krumholzibacteria bacterium]|nr:glycosyltransferase N-terminal domain-containing protein [Candidatus Krumholzibacteria bacterium]